MSEFKIYYDEDGIAFEEYLKKLSSMAAELVKDGVEFQFEKKEFAFYSIHVPKMDITVELTPIFEINNGKFYHKGISFTYFRSSGHDSQVNLDIQSIYELLD